MMHKNTLRGTFSLLGIFTLFITPLAHAHVKWFVEYDVSARPLAISTIISSPIFWSLSIASIIVMYVGFVVDQRISPIPLITKWENKLGRHAAAVMRWGIALFFIQMVIFFPHMILTPELISDSANIRYLHLGIAFTALLPSTAALSGLGLIALYLFAVKDFGLIHLLDYTMYWGVIIFMLMETIYKGRKRDLALHIVRIFIVFCLLWGGLEKFAHPQLTYNLLAQKPELTFGINPVFFLQAAAFVEICAAYLILSGRTAAKIGACILLFFFLIAIIPFGLVVVIAT
ncbi:MAG: hypothetical protein NWQ13_03920 [Glaciimonas sp.]|nr:hypothetical protein [Glaciimonas sp.]